jgi:diaminopimelate epimerase
VRQRDGGGDGAAGLTGRVPFGEAITVWNPGGLVRARAGEDGWVTLWGNATVEWTGTVEVDADGARDLRVEALRAEEVAAWDAVRRGAAGAAGR